MLPEDVLVMRKGDPSGANVLVLPPAGLLFVGEALLALLLAEGEVGVSNWILFFMA